MEDTASKIPNWIRWILVPVASPVTFVVVGLVAGIAAKLMVFLQGDRGFSGNLFEYLLVPGAAAYCAVLVTIFLAPSGKQLVGVLVAAAWIFMCGVGAVFAVVAAEYKGLLPVAAIAVGCAVAAYSEHASVDD